MKILLLILVAACIACGVTARAQDEGEARPAPSRGLLKRGLLGKGKTTTTTTQAPQEEAEYEEEYADEGEAQEPSTEAPPSSTEGKKLVAGGVRPFRSNTDLLETLKRRRAQAAEAKLHGHGSASATSAPAHDSPAEPAAPAAPAKSSYIKAQPVRKLSTQAQSPNDKQSLSRTTKKPGRRRLNNSVPRDTTEMRKTSIEPSAVTQRVNTRKGKPRATVHDYETTHETTTPYTRRAKAQRSETIGKKRYNTVPKEIQNEEASAPAPVKPARGRFGRPASRSIQEDHEEQNESAPAPIRTGRTFARRGGN